MAEIRNENHIVIHGWMRKELGLKGNELLVYALIYGFSQDGESAFRGKLQFVQDWAGISKKTAITILQNLSEKGLVTKGRSEYGKFEYGVKTTPAQGEEITPSGCKNYTDEVKKLHREGEKITPPSNNTSYITSDKDIDNSGCNGACTPIREKKHKYGQFKNVLLTEREYDKLILERENGKEAIEYLSDYRERKGYKAKSDYLAICNWVFKAIKEEQLREKELKQREARLAEQEAKVAVRETQKTLTGNPFLDLLNKENKENKEGVIDIL